MPLPTSLKDLSVSEASNSPSGGESPTSADNYLRLYASYIRQLASAGADLASAATITPPSTGSSFLLTGTTATSGISSTDSWDGRTVMFTATGAWPLTHSASLLLPGAANLTLAAGDTIAFRQESAGVWRCVMLSKASGTGIALYLAASAVAARTALGFSAAVVDRAYAEYTTNAALTAVIPYDDTQPQNTEGTQILSVSLTPKSATNKIRLRFMAYGACNAVMHWAVALFQSGSASAIGAAISITSTADYVTSICCEVEIVAGGTSPLTFSARVGPTSAGTLRLNGNSTTRVLGGSGRATLIAEEIAL